MVRIKCRCFCHIGQSDEGSPSAAYLLSGSLAMYNCFVLLDGLLRY